MAGPLAEAVADIRLSDGKFSADLATILARLRSAVATMESQARVDLTATIRVDDTAARATVQKFRDETTALGQIDVQLDAQTAGIAQAREELEKLRVVAESLSDTTVAVNVVLLAQEAIESAARLQEILTALGSEAVVVTVGGNAAELLSTIEVVNAELDKLDARRVSVNVSAEGLARTTAELDAASASADAAASDSGGFGRLASRLGFLSVAGVAGIGALGVAITALGVNSAASIEATVNSFTNILGSASQAKDLFTQLQQFAIPAPFDSIVLANTAKQLLAIGDNVNQVVPDVKTLAGAVALLGNQDPAAFEKLTLALGQIGSSVKVNLQDIRQISQALPGFNAQQQLAAGAAERLGITTAEATKQISDGSLQGADAMRILIEQMAAFPGAATAISSAADTLKGKLSAFKDVVKLDLIGAFTGVTGQLKDALLPLSDSLDVAFKAIGPQLASSLGNLIPTIGPFVEQLGTALAPAFGGIFTGLGGVLEGLTPVLTAILPVVGELAKSFGDLAAAAGPGIAQTATVLGDILVPALQSLVTVVEALGPALGPLLEGFLAFKAVDALGNVFDRFAKSGETAVAKFTQFRTNLVGMTLPEGVEAVNTSLAKVGPNAESATTAIKGTTSATAALQTAANVAASSVVGFLSGIATQSDNATTAITGLVGAAGSIGTAFATGGPIGGAFAIAATGLGALVGHFEEGARKAGEFQKAVESLATAIEKDLGDIDVKTIDLGKIVDADEFQKQILDAFGPDLRQKIGAQVKGTFTNQDITNALREEGNGLGTLFSKALGASITVDPNLITDIAKQFSTNTVGVNLTATLESQFGFRPLELQRLAQEGAEGVRQVLERVLGAPINVSPDLLIGIANAFNSLKTTGAGVLAQTQADLAFTAKSATDLTQALVLSGIALVDNGHAVSSFADAQAKSINSVDANTKALAAQAPAAQSLTDQYQTMATALFGLSPAFTQFAQNLDVTPALDRVKKSADDLKTTFSDLTSALSQSISNQNLQAQLDGLSTSLDAVIGQDKFDAAKQRADSISSQIQDQQSRIADLKASLAEAEAKALQDAADLDVRIADARKFGSVTGLAALEAARANVGDQAAKAQRELDKAERQIGDLQDQLAGIDVTTPQRLIDTVKQQAKTAGVDLWTFLLQGPTAEARQLYQQDLAAVVNSAFTNIQSVDDKQGPQAALDLLGSIQSKLHDQLIAGGLSPGTADEIVQNMLHPAELTKSLTDELNANLAAATAAADAAGHTVDVGLTTTDIEKFLADLQEKLSKAPPVSVPFTFNFSEKNPFTTVVTPDFADLDKQLATHGSSLMAVVIPDTSGIQGALDVVNGRLPATVVPDFADSDKQMATHGAPLSAVVAPDFADADKQLATHDAPVTTTVQPDTSLLDQLFAQPHTVNVSVVPDFTEFNQQLALTGIGVAVPAADGGILQFFRHGGFSGLRDAAHVAQIAPAGAWRVWAEPETGGEGYVPLALSKRDRSTEIVRTIADMFGYRLEPKIDVNPTIDIFPAVSPVVNLHPSFTVPPSLLPDRAGPERSLVQMFAHTLATFGQPTTPFAPQTRSGNRYSPWSGRFSDSLRGFDWFVPYNVASERERTAMSPATVSSVASNLTSSIVNSVVQSLMTDSPPPSRPAVTSVVHMTGWTTASPSPSWDRLVAGDPKIPDLAAFANGGTTIFALPGSTVLSALSQGSVPSMFEHDNPASPSPVGSQLVVWGSVPREALPPSATGGPAQLFANLTAGSMSAWFDPKTPNVTTVASLFAQNASGGFTSIVDRPPSAGAQIFHTAVTGAGESLMFHAAGPHVTVMPSQVTALFGAQPTHVTPLLNPELAVQVTSTPDRELAQAVRELTMMLRSGSPHSERLARAESIARHIHVHEGAITLTSDKPRQSARELVDELTRMAY